MSKNSFIFAVKRKKYGQERVKIKTTKLVETWLFLF